LGEKLIPRFAALLGETPKCLLDVLAYAEHMGWIVSAEDFIAACRLRNRQSTNTLDIFPIKLNNYKHQHVMNLGVLARG
jgi:hypothetical protein